MIWSDAEKRAEVFEVAPGVYYRKGNLAIRDQCNCVYLVDGDSVAVVDAPPGAQELFPECQALFGKPLRTLFLTHGHGDHCKGLEAFTSREVEIYCARGLYDSLSKEQKAGPAHWNLVEGSLRVSLGTEWPVQLSTLPGTAHSPYDMLVGLPREGLLCTGDFAVEYQTAYFHSADIAQWIRFLRRVHAAGGYRSLLAGHGPEPFPFDYLLDFADHLQRVLVAAGQCLERLEPTHRPDLSVEQVSKAVDAFFAQSDALAASLVEKAGDPDARRSVRMTTWNLLTPDRVF